MGTLVVTLIVLVFAGWVPALIVLGLLLFLRQWA
jgi:hypothetical protein